MGTFTLGCAVWTCRDWLGNLYPAKTQSRDFLRLFGQRFNAVEGNTTFYAVPPVSTLEKWKRETPEAFRFCLKIPRDFSHQGDVWPHAEAIVSFHDHAEAILGDRLGPFFLQLPESYGPAQGPDLSRVLNQWRRRCSTDINVELRHPSWFAEGELRQRLLTMLTRLNTGQVILDTRPVYEGPGDAMSLSQNKKPRLPVLMKSTADTIFVRFISHPIAEVNLPYFEEWARRVEQWLEEGKEIYFFVHCPREAHSPENARRFQALLEERGVAVPPLPWNGLPPEPTQQKLV